MSATPSRSPGTANEPLSASPPLLDSERLITPALRKSLTMTYTKIKRRLSMIDLPMRSNECMEFKDVVQKPKQSQKRMSVCLTHTPFPGLGKGEESQYGRKSDGQLREELNLLQTFGVKTDAAVPSELHIFRNRPKTRLIMSSVDLWGPNHAKSAFRSMGCSEAFTTMECRDRRERLALESVLSSKFNPRIADDVSTMKAFNTPMARTGRVNSGYALTERKTVPVAGRSRALQVIMENCEKLQVQNYALRRKVYHLTKTVRRSVDGLQRPSI